MSDGILWRVYGGNTVRTAASKSAALRLQRKYVRLGIQSSLYSGDGENWDLRRRLDSGGSEYQLPGDTLIPLQSGRRGK